MKLTGARILMECLREQKVDTIFGYPGGTILNVYDALYDCKEITHILTSHEQGAAHAADGYARSTGKVGVCFATSGPGATNLTTGIATAYYDSSPVVFITCNVSENLIGKDPKAGFHEGAGYSTKGVYRAYADCRMRTNENPEFCPACKQAIQEVIDFYTK